MKQLKSILVVLLVFALLISSIPAAHASGTQIKNVTISDDGILSWDPFDGADYYSLRIGTKNCIVQSKKHSTDLNARCLSFNLEKGTYKVELAAMRSDNTLISDKWTGSFTYDQDVETLVTPTNLRWDGNVASWDAVPHAQRYLFELINRDTGAAQARTVTTNSFDVYNLLTAGTSTYYFKVYAQATGYYNSAKATGPDTSLTWPQQRTVTDVSVTLNAPRAGAKPSYTAAVPAGEDYQIIMNMDDESTLYGVSWYCKDTRTWINWNNPGVFEAGRTYMAQVYLKVTSAQSYHFADPADINATINGADAQCAYLAGDDDELAVWLYYTVPGEETVTDVNLTIADPVAGRTPSYHAMTPQFVRYKVEDYDVAPYWKDGVCWSLVSEGFISSDLTPEFILGARYTVQISVILTDSSRFDFAESALLNVTVNDNPAAYRYYPEEKNLVVSYTFTIIEYKIGDVDCDGKVDIFDASAIQKSIAGAAGYPNYAKMSKGDIRFLIVDIDDNGVVDIFDASLIQKWTAGSTAAQHYGINTPIA